MNIPAHAMVTLTWHCTDCQGGRQMLDKPFCGSCGRAFEMAELRALPMEAETMPCGHSFRYIVEEAPCGTCDGDLIVSRQLTLAELADVLAALRQEGAKG